MVIRNRPFLFGKLPAHGDFVGRGLAPAQRAAWDGRCTSALGHAREQLGAGFDAAMEEIAPRAFLLAPGDDEPYWQAGCVAPSCDSAGRAFLFVLGIADGVGWADHGWCAALSLAPNLRRAISGQESADMVFAGASADPVADEGGVALPFMDIWTPAWIADAATVTPGERNS